MIFREIVQDGGINRVLAENRLVLTEQPTPDIGMLAAPAGYFKYQSPRRKYAPQHFKDRLAVASDVRVIRAWIGFFGHPGDQQAVR